MNNIDRLQKTLNYQFNDEQLLTCALTHRSAGRHHYERMEFLGDSILSFVISDAIYQHFPVATEGELSRLRAHLVKGDTLSDIAQSLKLGDYLILGPGELKSGGFRRKSILADVFESIIGAIYLDSGTEQAKKFILEIYETRIKMMDPELELKDPKTRLQEHMQARGLTLPEYEVVKTSGSAHNQTFEVTCSISLLDGPVRGKGSSRRKAEQEAAQKTLTQING